MGTGIHACSGGQEREESREKTIKTAGKQTKASRCEGQKGHTKCSNILTTGPSFMGGDTSCDISMSSDDALGHFVSSYFWPLPGMGEGTHIS